MRLLEMKKITDQGRTYVLPDVCLRLRGGKILDATGSRISRSLAFGVMDPARLNLE